MTMTSLFLTIFFFSIFSRSENLSAISGPSLPSGPYMPYNPDDEPLYKSSSSGSEDEEESTLVKIHELGDVG